MPRFHQFAASLLGLGLLGLSGCATSYYVAVDSMARPDAPMPSVTGEGLQFYTFKSDDPKLQEGDLRYAEVASYLETALAAAGYLRTDDSSEADAVVTFSTKLSGPIRETRTDYEPIFYSRPTYSRVAVLNKNGKVVGYSVVPGPSYTDVVHYRTNETITNYDKILTLSARTPGENGKSGQELWNVTVRVTDGSQDLRSYIPVLAAAAMNYIGVQTEGERRFVLTEESEPVRIIRQGL